MGTAKGALKTLLEDQRKSGATINSSIIRSLTIGVLLVFRAVATTVGVVFDYSTTFSVSRQWCRKFASQEMGWSYRKATTAAQNLPKDWQEQGDTLKHRLANIVDREGIPPELVSCVKLQTMCIHVLIYICTTLPAFDFLSSCAKICAWSPPQLLQYMGYHCIALHKISTSWWEQECLTPPRSAQMSMSVRCSESLFRVFG
jgi:hypothetical protein